VGLYLLSASERVLVKVTPEKGCTGRGLGGVKGGFSAEAIFQQKSSRKKYQRQKTP